MGKNMFCDICRANVPIEENFQKVEVGGNLVAECCITCGTKVANFVKGQVIEASKAIAAAEAAVQTPSAPAEVPAIPAKDLPQEPAAAAPKTNEGPAPAGQK